MNFKIKFHIFQDKKLSCVLFHHLMLCQISSNGSARFLEETFLSKYNIERETESIITYIS